MNVSLDWSRNKNRDARKWKWGKKKWGDGNGKKGKRGKRKQKGQEGVRGFGLPLGVAAKGKKRRAIGVWLALSFLRLKDEKSRSLS